MEITTAATALSALSQETRLRVFKLLLEFGRDGVNPSFLAKQLEVPANTLSFHLANLSKAGLAEPKKKGRTIVYRANTGLFSELINFLSDDCCSQEKKKRKTTKC